MPAKILAFRLAGTKPSTEKLKRNIFRQRHVIWLQDLGSMILFFFDRICIVLIKFEKTPNVHHFLTRTLHNIHQERVAGNMSLYHGQYSCISCWLSILSIHGPTRATFPRGQV